eukprot:6341918-Alexandrium_andersonii.AAC.1
MNRAPTARAAVLAPHGPFLAARHGLPPPARAMKRSNFSRGGTCAVGLGSRSARSPRIRSSRLTFRFLLPRNTRWRGRD